MAENCKLIEVDAEMQQVVPDFIAFKEQFRGIAGKERPSISTVHFLCGTFN